MRWKHLIPEVTEELLLAAFKIVFECNPSDAEITFLGEQIVIKTKEKIILHGGLGFHTDQPNTEDLYYSGFGCTWNIDNDGIRYYYLDKETGLPIDWSLVVETEIVYKYLQSLNQVKTLVHDTRKS